MSSPVTPLEQALARVAGGDPGAFRTLVGLTREHLLVRALRIVKRRDLAEEVLQEVYVKAWRHASQYDGAIAKPMTWLISMLRNTAIDVLRARRQEERCSAPLDDGRAPDDVPDGLFEAAEDRCARALDARRLDACLQGLHPQHRQSLALAYYHGLSHAEVASHLCVPVGSVKGWIHRGLDHLRRQMAAPGG